jgi:hypothetical protein
MNVVTLPLPDGTLAPFRRSEAAPFPPGYEPFPRVASAAAHVVADPAAMTEPWERPVLDWDATLAFREHLWSLGFAVAEAMDTSQRGMGLSWPVAAELIERACAAARAPTSSTPPRRRASTMSSAPTRRRPNTSSAAAGASFSWRAAPSAVRRAARRTTCGSMGG